MGDIHPANLGYLVLLWDKINIFCLCKEVNNDLGGVLFGRIGNGFAECGVDYNVYRGLFQYLTMSCFNFRLALFNVTLGERPVSAVDMLYKQDLCIAMEFSVYNRAA